MLSLYGERQRAGIKYGMSAGIDDEIKERMRGYIAAQGACVKFQPSPWPPDSVSPYGWRDYDAMVHMKSCSWIVPPGTVVEEITYSMFDDTFTGNKLAKLLNSTPLA